jgi:hypothetical protein
MSLSVKVGQKIRHNSGTEYKVRMVGPGRDPELAIENQYGDIFIIDHTKHKYYKVVDGFFKVGKTYRFDNNSRTDTWTIQSVHELERPQGGESKQKAVAVMTAKSGYQDLQTLSLPDFDRMTLV